MAPAELLVGALAEMWSDTGQPLDLGSAFRAYGRAARAWQDAERLTVAEFCELLAVPRPPWSLAAWDAEGRTADADARLTRAGVARNDLPRLRRAAQARLFHLTNHRRTP